MKLIGVTGGVGCGKSEVLRYIETNYNCRIEFSDEIARALEAPGGAIYESLIRLLEQYPAEEVPTGMVGIVYKGYSKEIDDFLSWVLTSGRNHVHNYGLLQIEQELAERQTTKIEAVYTAQTK